MHKTVCAQEIKFCIEHIVGELMRAKTLKPHYSWNIFAATTNQRKIITEM